jgi:UDP-2,3-diacylglucosamine pyrophosphatase LpxH
VKSAVKFISNFEDTAAELAIENAYDFVVCGHIHQPAIRKVKNKKGRTLYLNSGDWVENLTALEYNNQTWKLFSYKTRERVMKLDRTVNTETDLIPEAFSAMLRAASN